MYITDISMNMTNISTYITTSTYMTNISTYIIIISTQMTHISTYMTIASTGIHNEQLLYVHRNHEGRGTQEGHVDFHAAPDL